MNDTTQICPNCDSMAAENARLRELLWRFVVRQNYLYAGETHTECTWCDVSIANRNADQLEHLPQCPVSQAFEILEGGNDDQATR